MNYYKATIQYDGTGYFGFQWQKDIPTIQNDFNLAIQKLIPGKVTTMSTSRTDTGVHAFEQVVKITIEEEIFCGTFLTAFNQVLPAQVKCKKIMECDARFSPNSDHLSKEYRYYFTNKNIVPLSEKRFIANYSKPLNLEAMHECVNALIGTHDFKNFCSAGSNVKTTIRSITQCELKEINPQDIFSQYERFTLPIDLKTCYELKVVGNGFLKQMIRHIVSGLWMVGGGKLTTNEFMNILHGPKNEKRIWKVAPPNGLFLYQINYRDN